MFFNYTVWRHRAAGLPVGFMCLILAALLLAACTGPQPGAAQRIPPNQVSAEPVAAPTQAAAAPAGGARQAPPVNLTQTAQAGAVTVEITPLNLDDDKAVTLDFEIAMNTHSVDLGMDLAQLAVLKAGDKEVAASGWQAPGGGHHVTGKLMFPKASATGKPILEGATRFSVVIRNLAGVPNRTFTWNLDQTEAGPGGGQG